jgi:hypothetical protein
MTTGAAAIGSRTNWFLQLVVAAVTIVLVLRAKQALSRLSDPVLGGSAEPITGVLILRSGWGATTRWAEEQARLGTLATTSTSAS